MCRRRFDLSYEVLSFGEALWDLLPSGEKLGGAPLNFAYRMASLGRSTALVTRVGSDALGDRALELMGQLGLDMSFVQRDKSRPTGTVPIVMGPGGSPDYTILPNVAYDHIVVEPALLDTARAARCICYGTLSQREPISRMTLAELLEGAENALRVYDINLRRDCYSADLIDQSLERSSVFKLNDAEVAEVAAMFGLPSTPLTEFCYAALARWNLEVCVVTLGSRGAFALSNNAVAYTPGRRIAVADTIGAGDAFTAGFTHKYLGGSLLSHCVAYGNALGALVSQTEGATTPISQQEIEEFLASDTDVVIDPELEDLVA